MTVVSTVTGRNATFAATRFRPGLRMMPALRAIVLGCVDPRVDPEQVLGLETGEAAVIRNVGGRVTPAVLHELTMLREVTRAAGGDLAAGWEVVVLQHTDCGITRVGEEGGLLAGHLGVEPSDLDRMSVQDPFQAVAVDMATLDRAVGDRLGAGVVVSGLVYDVATGRVSPVAGPPQRS